jgi:multisubunit Na+/H+ antiporter MnhG subunit
MNVRENVGILDSAIRSVLAVVLLICVTEGFVAGYFAIAATAVAIVMLLTASIGNCPLYKVIGLNTWGKTEHYLIEH